MRIKLDENIPVRLAEELTGLGHDVDTAVREGLKGCNDRAVWAATQQAGRFLVTQDLDFSDLRQFAPGTHCGILLVRLRNPSRRQLIQRVKVLFQRENVEAWARAFVAATGSKVRARRPSR